MPSPEGRISLLPLKTASVSRPGYLPPSLAIVSHSQPTFPQFKHLLPQGARRRDQLQVSGKTMWFPVCKNQPPHLSISPSFLTSQMIVIISLTFPSYKEPTLIFLFHLATSHVNIPCLPSLEPSLHSWYSSSCFPSYATPLG